MNPRELVARSRRMLVRLPLIAKISLLVWFILGAGYFLVPAVQDIVPTTLAFFLVAPFVIATFLLVIFNVYRAVYWLAR
jgi:hypothetical protein